ncbi:GPI ethanolamine phosphate transferase 3 subunit O [Nematocida major]|uniref:GPI ethanolamine phosphate transferase 3 subunit O n=1 Tax=Nematocida major TaxID=1912982 RepID=UPI002008BBFC|nr:GPI ethanolamine phosphate transferase 3 subunit O [Nematocida major]KAH9386857.1 GPI ethanolamine phosphate transferase 3 subunit O [Nematocida major]
MIGARVINAFSCFTAHYPFVLCLLGIIAYSKSLFVERSPVGQHNTASSQPLYKKGVILLMDGVRADAIHRVDPSFKTKYHDNFSVLSTIPAQDVFRAVSVTDLPTGTAMRVLSTFSGIPTTLLSAQRSFSMQASNVDNFVTQVQRNGYSLKFYGDETWTYLFPDIKTSIGEVYHPYGLIPMAEEERIIEKALSVQKETDVLILHMISPDSYGHVYGIDSTEVKATLEAMNKLISALHERLDDESFIAVLSDHGVNEDGSHGGTSFKEKAASFMFIAKGALSNAPDHLLHAPKTRAYTENIQDVSQLNLAEPVNIISQNDILPTLCAFLGVPVPYNSSGALIPQILHPDKHRSIYEWEIARQKKALELLHGVSRPEILPKVEKKNVFQSAPSEAKAKAPHTWETLGSSINELIQTNQILSANIHDLFHASSLPGMLLGLFTMGLGCALHLLLARINVFSPYVALSVFSIFMVAHSVYSIIHEDIISILMCLVCGRLALSPHIYAFLPVSLLVGEHPLHAMDRFRWIRWIGKVPHRYRPLPRVDNLLFAGSVLCVCLGKVTRGWHKRSHLLSSLGACLFSASRFFSNGIPRASRSFVALLQPGLLSSVLYAPASAISFYFVFSPLVLLSIRKIECDVRRGCFLFFLIKCMFFVTGHNHALSSINWESAFLFSRKSIPVLSGVFVAADLLLPYIYVAYALGMGLLRTLHMVVLLQGVCAVLVCAINFWFIDNSLMWFIFTGRTIFECFFLIAFMGIQGGMGLYSAARGTGHYSPGPRKGIIKGLRKAEKNKA